MAYAKIEEKVWSDRRRRALPEDARWLLLYLETCPHRNRLGAFVLDPLYAASDLQWTPDRAEEALQELEEAGFIGRDPEARVVLVRDYLEDNPLDNGNVVKAATRNDLASLPPTPLVEDLLESVEKYARAHYGPLLDALRLRIQGRGSTTPDPNPPGNGSRNGSANRSPNGIGNGGYTLTQPEPSPTEPEPNQPEVDSSEESDSPGAAPSSSATSPPWVRLEGWLEEPQAVEAAQALAGDTENPDRWALGFLGTFGPNGTEERLLGALETPVRRRKAVGIALTRYLSEGKPYEARLFRAFLRRVISEQTLQTGPLPGTEAHRVAQRPEPSGRPRRTMIQLSKREGGGLVPLSDLLPGTGT